MADHEARRLVRAIIRFWSAGNLPTDEAILQLGSMLGISRAEVMARMRGEAAGSPARTERPDRPISAGPIPSFGDPAPDLPQP